MEKILKGARKYKLGLTLAHQHLHQLQRNPKVASAVLANPCVRIVFRVGDDDARKLGEGFASFDADKLTTLEKFHALARVERNDWDFNVALQPPDLSGFSAERREAIRNRSRARYARPRAEVEAVLREGLVARGMGEAPAAEVRKPEPAPPPVESPVFAAPAPPPAKPPAPAEVPQPAPSAEVPNAATGMAGKTTQHEAVKDQIMAAAESLDYTVTREVTVGAYGRFDLILKRGERNIACEISDTTPPEIEADHIRKRLASGCGHVAVISASRRKLDKIQAVYMGMGGDTAKVGFYSPKAFIEQLREWAMADPAGGETERDKPRRGIFDGESLTPEERKAEQERLRLELARKMGRTPPA